jgi:Rieske 2Fe-2S family protein
MGPAHVGARIPAPRDEEERIVSTLEIDRVADRYRTPGFSLPGHLYASPEAYETDLAAVFGRVWLFAAAEAELPEPGDYVTIDVDRRSILLVRDDDMTVRAFHNVCRHRGSRLLDDRTGCVGNIVCPYHQWTYDTSGTLLHAESTAPDFDRSRFPLRPVHVRSVAGLLFICLADEPPSDIDDFAAVVTPYLAPHDLGKARVAAQQDWVEHGNWKLVMENNRECAHCGGHPELIKAFFPVYAYTEAEIGPRLRAAWDRYLRVRGDFRERCTELGLPYEAVERLEAPATAFRIEREPLDLAGESFTLDGVRACRRLLMDEDEARLGRLSLHVQPNAWLHVMGDHAVTFSVLPLARDRTLVRTTWLVHADAVEGRDYDLDRLTTVWKQTNDQDMVFVARAQRGVEDPDYVPGPYLPSEYQVDAFCTWYTNRLAEYEHR